MTGFELGEGPLEGETDEEFEQRMKKEKVIDEVAAWIDTRVIAEMVADHLEQEGEEVTVESCKEAWLGTLENLGSGIGIARSCGEAAEL
ncbi:hypothetical protein ES703_84520 [subsurface metagenome]